MISHSWSYILIWNIQSDCSPKLAKWFIIVGSFFIAIKALCLTGIIAIIKNEVKKKVCLSHISLELANQDKASLKSIQYDYKI